MKMNMRDLKPGDVLMSYADSKHIDTYVVIKVGFHAGFGKKSKGTYYIAPAIKMIDTRKLHKKKKKYIVTKEYRKLNSCFESVFRDGERIFG